ncbi:MAG: methionyl-tRNA formyltransferase [Nitriliruptoraceae bacterium]
MTLRVAFFGTPDVAVPSLLALHAATDIDVVVVVTNPDRPRGRHGTPIAPPVKRAALKLGIDVWQPTEPVQIDAHLHELSLDVAAVVAYGKILRPSTLATTSLGFVNLHFSLLPRWRGAAPVQHALRAGDERTGVTTFLLDEGMDTGPIIATSSTSIEPLEDAGMLLDRLAASGAPVLVTSLQELASGLVPVPQPAEGATYAPKINDEDLQIRWSWSADQVVGLVRSASPRPGAHTLLQNQRVKVFDARSHPIAPGEDSLPGQVLAIEGDDALVATGQGTIAVGTLQVAGRKRMTARDVANGMGGLVGDRFGFLEDQ